MFDIHYHLLFGVDDGPKTIEASVALAEASIAEGVTHIVCSPHANSQYEFRPHVNRERLAMLDKRLAGRITFQNRTKYTINGKRYLLVEFPEMGIVHHISDILCRLIAFGMVPIITHPERNPVLERDPERMAEWLRAGCLVQVTAASLKGRFGKRAEEMSLELLRKNWVHIVASDAHSIIGRPPSMRDAYERLKGDFGQATADRLCVRNPRAVFMGEPLTAQPEPLGLFEEPKPRKRGFLDAIFGR